MSEEFPFKYSHGGFYYIEDDGSLDEAKKRWAAYPKMKAVLEHCYKGYQDDDAGALLAELEEDET